METSPPTVLRIRSGAFKSRRNFGGPGSRKRGESNFLRQFERAYFAQVGGGIAADEFALPQFGVADLVWVAWTPDPAKEDFSAVSLESSLARKSLFAFEAKLRDWQKALQQAFRYRYFSDKSIVVMPTDSSAVAIRNLPAFKNLGVGLWTFDKHTQRIRKHFTPTNVRALNRDARKKAIALISSKIDFSKLAK